MKPTLGILADIGNLKRAIILFASALILGGTGSPSFGDTLECDTVTLEFEPRHDAVAHAACGHVAKAKKLLADCGLVQHHPLTIKIAEQVDHPAYGQCLGYFDTANECLRIATPDGYAVLLSEKDARAHLPPDEVFASIIAHELTHAFLLQSHQGAELGAAEHEFLASAFEMATLDEKRRDVLLEANPIKSGGSMDLVNPGIYMLSPRAFANNAWLLFQREENGCALVRKITSGEFRFPRD